MGCGGGAVRLHRDRLHLAKGARAALSACMSSILLTNRFDECDEHVNFDVNAVHTSN